MRARTHEHHQALLGGVVEPIDQEKVAAGVALPVTAPVASERVIQPFRPKRTVIGDQVHHGLLEPAHVVAAGVRQALPVLEEGFGVVAAPGQRGALTDRGSFRGHRRGRQQSRNGHGGPGRSRQPRAWPRA